MSRRVYMSVLALTFQKYIRIHPFDHKANWLFFTIRFGRVELFVERVFGRGIRYEMAIR